MASSQPAERRLTFLDGMRGWGAVIVLLHHIKFSGMSVFGSSAYFDFITDGHFAVYVFYVLSGFALTIKFIEKPGMPIPWRRPSPRVIYASLFRFLLRVLLRIALFAAGLFFHHAAAQQTGSGWLDANFSFAPGFGGFLKFSLWDVFFKYNPDKTYNSSLGTITYEFWGSMLAFFIVAVFVKGEKVRRVHLLPVIALGAFSLQSIAHPIACFVFGYLLAELYHAAPKNLKYYATALLPIVVLGVTFIHWHDNSFHLIVLAVAMIFAGCFSPWLQKFFSCRLSNFLGQISFPLYLIHICIICSFSSKLYLVMQTDNGYST